MKIKIGEITLESKLEIGQKVYRIEQGSGCEVYATPYKVKSFSIDVWDNGALIKYQIGNLHTEYYDKDIEEGKIVADKDTANKLAQEKSSAIAKCLRDQFDRVMEDSKTIETRRKLISSLMPRIDDIPSGHLTVGQIRFIDRIKQAASDEDPMKVLDLSEEEMSKFKNILKTVSGGTFD